MSSSSRPPGFTSLTPLLVVSPAREAITFYQQVFAARVTTRMDGPDGTVWHAELELDAGRLQVMDPLEEFATLAQDPADDHAHYSVTIYVDDVDAVAAAAVDAGATVREPVADFEVTGDRFASVRDPYGVRWSIMTRTVPHTDEQIQAGLDAWMASMS